MIMMVEDCLVTSKKRWTAPRNDNKKCHYERVYIANEEIFIISNNLHVRKE